VNLRRLSTRTAGFDAKLAALTRYEAARDPKVERTVRRILADVKKRGDAAVRAYAKKFDGAAPREIKLTRELFSLVPRPQKYALLGAYHRIKMFHLRQLQKSWEFTDGHGTQLGQRVTRLGALGCTCPEAKLHTRRRCFMNAVPAKVAGVRELIMVSPNPNPLVLAAAVVAGVDRVIGIGGAQAVAALAYGTKSIPRVDKIVGRAMHTLLKRAPGVRRGRHRHDCRPLRDSCHRRWQRSPEWVAMDLFSQAEHDESAQAILLSPRKSYLDAVQACIARLLPGMKGGASLPRR